MIPSRKPLCQLIGAGRAGRALALAMSRASYQFTWIGSRRAGNAEKLAGLIGCRDYGVGFEGFSGIAEFFIIAVPDNQIASIASGAVSAGIIGKGTMVAHLSGALGSDVLADAQKAGASVMAFHPSQTFARESDPMVFSGICFDMEGDENACIFGEQLARDLGAISVRFTPAQRVVIHLAESVASNYMVALVRMAEVIMGSAEIPETTAHKILSPLVLQTARNIADSGTLNALTGPIARGDSSVIKRHLSVLDTMNGEYSVFYKTLARIAVRMSVERGDISGSKAAELESILAG
jgi:predicted short-subunit dehydrogenase-like oxidoreductase (DUF2520 family)